MSSIKQLGYMINLLTQATGVISKPIPAAFGKDFLVNKFEEAVKERFTRYELDKLKSGVDLNKEETGLLKAYKSIGSKRLRESILSHIKTVAKIGKGMGGNQSGRLG